MKSVLLSLLLTIVVAKDFVQGVIDLDVDLPGPVSFLTRIFDDYGIYIAIISVFIFVLFIVLIALLIGHMCAYRTEIIRLKSTPTPTTGTVPGPTSTPGTQPNPINIPSLTHRTSTHY